MRSVYTGSQQLGSTYGQQPYYTTGRQRPYYAGQRPLTSHTGQQQPTYGGQQPPTYGGQLQPVYGGGVQQPLYNYGYNQAGFDTSGYDNVSRELQAWTYDEILIEIKTKVQLEESVNRNSKRRLQPALKGK